MCSWHPFRVDCSRIIITHLRNYYPKEFLFCMRTFFFEVITLIVRSINNRSVLRWYLCKSRQVFSGFTVNYCASFTKANFNCNGWENLAKYSDYLQRSNLRSQAKSFYTIHVIKRIYETRSEIGPVFCTCNNYLISIKQYVLITWFHQFFTKLFFNIFLSFKQIKQISNIRENDSFSK